MTRREAGIENARLEARKLLKRFGVESVNHVNVERFAARLHVDLVVAPLHGAAAQLVVGNGRASIVLSDRLTDPADRHFAIGHELGHFVLKHPSVPIAELCSPHPRSRFSDNLDIEDEANGFASELLTPESVVQAVHRAKPMTLNSPAHLACLCGFSIESSAIRVTESTERVCAAVLSGRDGLRWVASARKFVHAFGASPAEGRCLDRRSLAWRYFDHGATSKQPKFVPAAAWLDVPGEPPILEHSMPGSEPGTVLTMLWVPHRDVGRRASSPGNVTPGRPKGHDGSTSGEAVTV